MENYERRSTDPWMLLKSGENIMPRSGRREVFPEARLLRANFFHEGLQTNFVVHGDDFSLWVDVRDESIH